MTWHEILTRNIAWKVVSILLAVLIWNAISQVQSSNNPDRFKAQPLTEQRLDNTAIIPTGMAFNSCSCWIDLVTSKSDISGCCMRMKNNSGIVAIDRQGFDAFLILRGGIPMRI